MRIYSDKSLCFYANFEDKSSSVLLSIVKNKRGKYFIGNSLFRRITHGNPGLHSKGQLLFYNTFGAELKEEILNILFNFFEKQFELFLNDLLAKGLVLPCSSEIVYSFCVGGLTVSALRWIKSNYKIPKEELAACQYLLLKRACRIKSWLMRQALNLCYFCLLCFRYSFNSISCVSCLFEPIVGNAFLRRLPILLCFSSISL